MYTRMCTFHPRQEANAIVRPELETALKDEAIGLLGNLQTMITTRIDVIVVTLSTMDLIVFNLQLV